MTVGLIFRWPPAVLPAGSAMFRRWPPFSLAFDCNAEMCASVGDTEIAQTLYEQLTPYAGLHAIGLAAGSLRRPRRPGARPARRHHR